MDTQLQKTRKDKLQFKSIDQIFIVTLKYKGDAICAICACFVFIVILAAFYEVIRRYFLVTISY